MDMLRKITSQLLLVLPLTACTLLSQPKVEIDPLSGQLYQITIEAPHDTHRNDLLKTLEKTCQKISQKGGHDSYLVKKLSWGQLIRSETPPQAMKFPRYTDHHSHKIWVAH